MEYQTNFRNKNRGYMGLVVWQKAMELFELVWNLTHKSKIDYKLRSQVIEAAQSVSANIAEGYGRRSVKEYIQFLYIASGSAAETMTRIMGLNRVQQISDARFHDFDVLHYEVENRLLRLIEKLEEKRDNDDWVTRIAEDPSEYDAHYSTTPSLHHSIAPSPLQHSTTPSSPPSLHHSSTPLLHSADA